MVFEAIRDGSSFSFAASSSRPLRIFSTRRSTLGSRRGGGAQGRQFLAAFHRVVEAQGAGAPVVRGEEVAGEVLGVPVGVDPGGHLQHPVAVHHLEGGDVPLLRLGVPPEPELAQDGQGGGGELAGAVDPPERLRVDFADAPAGLHHLGARFLVPLQAAQLLEDRGLLLPDAVQVGDVLGGVVVHRRRQGPGRPVGLLARLAQLHAEEMLHQRGVADPGQAAELGADHGVEDLGRLGGADPAHQAQVEVGPVEDPGGVPRDLPERLQVGRRLGEGVDQEAGVVLADRDQADALLVVVEGVGLGVDRQIGARLQPGSLLGDGGGGVGPGGVDRFRLAAKEGKELLIGH